MSSFAAIVPHFCWTTSKEFYCTCIQFSQTQTFSRTALTFQSAPGKSTLSVTSFFSYTIASGYFKWLEIITFLRSRPTEKVEITYLNLYGAVFWKLARTFIQKRKLWSTTGGSWSISGLKMHFICSLSSIPAPNSASVSLKWRCASIVKILHLTEKGFLRPRNDRALSSLASHKWMPPLFVVHRSLFRIFTERTLSALCPCLWRTIYCC